MQVEDFVFGTNLMRNSESRKDKWGTEEEPVKLGKPGINVG